VLHVLTKYLGSPQGPCKLLKVLESSWKGWRRFDSVPGHHHSTGLKRFWTKLLSPLSVRFHPLYGSERQPARAVSSKTRFWLKVLTYHPWLVVRRWQANFVTLVSQDRITTFTSRNPNGMDFLTWYKICHG